MQSRITSCVLKRRLHHHFSTDSSSSLLTLAAKAGFDPEQHPDLSPPLRMSTTFDRTRESSSLIYGRTENPTRSLLENVCCDLEGGSEAIVFSSGIAAISSVFSQFSNIDLPYDVYHGTRTVLPPTNSSSSKNTLLFSEIFSNPRLIVRNVSVFPYIAFKRYTHTHTNRFQNRIRNRTIPYDSWTPRCPHHSYAVRSMLTVQI